MKHIEKIKADRQYYEANKTRLVALYKPYMAAVKGSAVARLTAQWDADTHRIFNKYWYAIQSEALQAACVEAQSK